MLVIKTYANKGTADIANGIASRAALKTLPQKVWHSALEALAILDSAKSVYDFWAFPSLKFEKLEHDRKSQCSIRINQKYRICFRWAEPDAYDVEITNYH